MSHMVCRPHQYILTKMAMPAYQPRSNAGTSYTISQPESYMGGGVLQSRYTSATTPQVNYNLSTATGDQSMFQPLFQTALLPNEQAKDQVSTIEKMVQPSSVVISNSANPTFYILPIMYVPQPSTPNQSQDNFNLKKDLSQLIQQELAEFELPIQPKNQVKSESQVQYWNQVQYV